MRFLRWMAGLVLVVVIVAGVLVAVVMLPYGPENETFVDIAPGTSTAGMAGQLQRAGVIRSKYAFEAMKWVHGGALKAGEYRFDHPVPMIDVFKRIRKGDVYTLTLLIPEGFNIFDIAQAVQEAGLGKRDAFLQAEQKHTELIAQWNPGASSLEGYLFPDTYRFSRHAIPLNMLSTMVKRFGQETQRLGMVGMPPEGVARVVTMASMVEKEVHIDAERATVAGVFENRLEAGMPLQTDPTVAYASMMNGTWTGVIHQSELHSASDYNTYVHKGLPPGPICNPGLAALKAALRPVKTEYMYFVADAGGATKFSVSLKEHAGNVADYRKRVK